MVANSHRLINLVWRAGLVLALVCAAIIVRDAAQTAASYSSGYDATDPSRCALGAGNVTLVTQIPLLGDSSQKIGVLRLRRSQTCDTIWPQVVLTAGAARLLKGRLIELTVRRPADNRTAPYPLALHGGQYGYGNQLGATACIQGSAQLLATANAAAGPAVTTRCAGG